MGFRRLVFSRTCGDNDNKLICGFFQVPLLSHLNNFVITQSVALTLMGKHIVIEITFETLDTTNKPNSM